MTGAVARLVDVVLPGRCAGRGRAAGSGDPGRAVCGACLAALRRPPCEAAGLLPGPALPRVLAAGEYADPLRSLIVAHKERGRLGLAAPLGVALGAVVAATVQTLGPSRVLVVPVPSRRSAVRARGHDPVLRLARVAARTVRSGGRPAAVAPVLVHRRRVADQVGLDPAARQANLHLALGLRASLPPDWSTDAVVVLVDDVITTGATLAEAARALRDGVPGALVRAAVLAAARTRRPAG